MEHDPHTCGDEVTEADKLAVEDVPEGYGEAEREAELAALTGAIEPPGGEA